MAMKTGSPIYQRITMKKILINTAKELVAKTAISLSIVYSWYLPIKDFSNSCYLSNNLQFDSWVYCAGIMSYVKYRIVYIAIAAKIIMMQTRAIFHFFIYYFQTLVVF